MAAPRPPRLLLVEDNPGDAGLFAEAVREVGLTLTLTVAPDVAQALDVLRQRPPQLPDLILLDFNLPRTGGLELLRKLKGEAKWRSIPVLALTSSRSEQDIRQFYDLGGNCYLVKPGDYAGLVALVAACRDFWLGVAILPRPNGER